MSNNTQKLFFYSFTTVSNKKYVVAINENERSKSFSIGGSAKIMGYVIEVKPSTESITNADLIKATGNLLNNAISAINTGKKSEDRALISLNYVSNGNHLFTASTDLEIEFNTQSLWYNYSRKFKNCMINLLSNWELNSPNYLI